MKSVIKTYKILLLLLVLLLALSPTYAFADSGKKQDLNYVSLGDSLAAGYLNSGKVGNGYPVYITEGIEKQVGYDVHLTNKGVGGYTTVNVVQQLSDQGVRQALNDADLVTVDAGANDLLGSLGNIEDIDLSNPDQLKETMAKVTQAIHNVQTNMSNILSQIKQLNPDVPIYVMGYYNAKPYLPEPYQIALIPALNQLNQVIQADAVQAGATFVPTFEAFEGHYQEYLPNPNNIHPNEAGYQVIATLFLDQIIPDLPAPGDGHDSGNQGGTWYTGKGKPGPEAGRQGDLYLDTDKGDVYQKAADGWKIIGNLKGPQGQTGPNGDKGDKGDRGDPGAQGPIGPSGTTIYTGKGTPVVDIGKEGDLYLNTNNDDLYKKISGKWEKIANLKGTKGDPGAPGAKGDKGSKGDCGCKNGQDQNQTNHNGSVKQDGNNDENSGLANTGAGNNRSNKTNHLDHNTPDTVNISKNHTGGDDNNIDGGNINNNDKSSKDDSAQGGLLPVTASSQPLFVLIGVLMAMLGGVVVFRRRKNKSPLS